MNRPIPTQRFDRVKAIVWFSAIPLLSTCLLGGLYFVGRWILKGLGA